MNQTLKLIISVIVDLLGMVSYVIPSMGFIGDLIFGPLQGIWIYYAYGTRKGALIGIAEEILPGTDFIPTCTIVHFLKKKKGK